MDPNCKRKSVARMSKAFSSKLSISLELNTQFLLGQSEDSKALTESHELLDLKIVSEKSLQQWYEYRQSRPSVKIATQLTDIPRPSRESRVSVRISEVAPDEQLKFKVPCKLHMLE